MALARLAYVWMCQGLAMLLYPLNLLLCARYRNRAYLNSVLHVSYMVHIPYYTTRILRRRGMKADYLAVGGSRTWDKCDFQIRPSLLPPVQVLKEFLLFWRVVARYEVIHSHFMITMSQSGWELPLLKRMGRKIVVHYRGCEVRDGEANRSLRPLDNICAECDYAGQACSDPLIRRCRARAARYGDAFLVTTPDLKDFAPRAEHLPFFAPEDVAGLPAPAARAARSDGEIRVVHATNHPGIEGTRQIEDAIARLRAKGYRLRFDCLRGVPHSAVLASLAGADLSIGKMKMGYYANAQIESMWLGVPTITWVRPEFMTEELRNSGFIFTTLDNLEATIEHYLRHPEELEAKRRIARSSIQRLHDNDALASRLMAVYEEIRRRA